MMLLEYNELNRLQSLLYRQYILEMEEKRIPFYTLHIRKNFMLQV